MKVNEREEQRSDEGRGFCNLMLKGGFGIFTAMLLGLGETASQLQQTIVNIQKKENVEDGGW